METGDWKSWTSCTSSCGEGTRQRTITCDGDEANIYCKSRTDTDKCIGLKCPGD